jgi:hypothetical protein
MAMPCRASSVTGSRRPTAPKSSSQSVPSASEQDVPRVRIGVEEAVLEDLAQERAEQTPRELRAVRRDRIDRRNVAQGPPLDLIHHQHSRGGQRGMHRRNGDAGVPPRLTRSRAPAAASWR